MRNKIITFGDGNEQLALYNRFKRDMRVTKVSVTSTHNRDKISAIKCIGCNRTLTCYEIEKYPYIQYINDKKYICTLTENNNKKTLYGTVPSMLFNIYAHKRKIK